MKHVHFLGIGGSGMNAVAGIAQAFGYTVSGCDMKESEYWNDLRTQHIPITIGHDPVHLDGIDILCITAAVLHQKDKPLEYTEALAKGIPVMQWQEFLGNELQKNKSVIAIAGTKGKTSTTALTGRLLEIAQKDPIVEVGGKVLDWGKNYRVGAGEYFVCEADEFNNNFLHFHPEIAVVTNIEMDHPEFFNSEDEYNLAFLHFVQKLSVRGTLVGNADSPGVQWLLSQLTDSALKIVTYSMKSLESDIALASLHTQKGMTEFIVRGFQDSDTSFKTTLSGMHTISNLLAVIAIAKILEISPSAIQLLLDTFQGTGRRFELICEKRGVAVYNDYAHNPMSVKAALEGARMKYPLARIWAVFQPHMYTRTKLFLEQFAHAFSFANEVIILEIFASREKDLPISKEVDSQMLASRIYNVDPQLHVRSIVDKEKAVTVLLSELKPGDVVVNMGAGDNGIIVETLKERL